MGKLTSVRLRKVNEMRKINDKIILGLVVGVLANIPKTILCTSFNKSGITKRKCSDLAASMFIPARKVFTTKGEIFGFLCDFVIAAFDGIFLVHLLLFTGKVTKGKAIIKGLLSGLFIFGIFRGIFAKVGTGKVYPKDMLTNMVMGTNSSIWGIIAGLLVLMLGHEDLFQSKSSCPTSQQ